MTALEVLTAARELLSDPAKWTKGEFARGADGDWVDEHSQGAVCFCAVGAIFRCAGEMPQLGFEAAQLLRRVLAHRGLASISGWNDALGRTHAEVLAAFDRAIELAKSEARS